MPNYSNPVKASMTNANKTTTGNTTEGKRKPMGKELYFDWIESDWTKFI